MVDLLVDLRDERKAIEATVSALKARETEANFEYLKMLRAQNTDTARGARHAFQASRSSREFYTCTDWDAFYKYVKKNSAWDLLHRRLGERAVKDRLEAGEKLPVEVESVATISLRKIAK
jgi:hypothetical protein